MTGSMMNHDRNSDRLMISILGGDCCKPNPCRKIDITVTMNGKHVIMIARPGAKLSSVIPAIRKIELPARLSPPPRSSVIS